MATTLKKTGAALDYIRYVYGQPEKTTQINSPALLNFSLAPFDGAFVKLVRGNHIDFTTTTYGIWFSGYITNDPALEYLGKDGDTDLPVYGFQYEATSDEYILNIKPLGIVPPFLGATQGDILKSLIEVLAPGKFDVTGIQSGLTMSSFMADPDKNFLDVVKEFADQAYYRFYSKKISSTVYLYYKPQASTDATIQIDGDSYHFTPSRLTMAPESEPIVNDALVIGDIEAQGYMNEWFVGDGYTGKYPLLSGVYGVDKSTILDETFSGDEADPSKWIEVDDIQDYLQVDSGYLNVLGGTGDLSDVYLMALSTIPLEGNLRLTHGEFDFVNGSDGVIAGLWTSLPNNSYSGCLYGIECTASSDETILRPIIGGVVNTSFTITASDTKRYIIRTLISYDDTSRLTARRKYRRSDGATGYYGGTTKLSVPMVTTLFTELDPATGKITNQYTWVHRNFSQLSTLAAAYYIPVASDDLHITISNITISIPLQVSLESVDYDTWRATFHNYDPDTGNEITPDITAVSWDQILIGANEVDCSDGMAPAATITTTNSGKIEKGNIFSTPKYNPGYAALEFFKDSTKLNSNILAAGTLVHARYRRAGVAMGRAQNSTSITAEQTTWGDNGLRTLTANDLKPPPRTSLDCELAAAALVEENYYQHYSGTYTQWSMYEFTGEPLPGTVLNFVNLPSTIPTVEAELITSVKTVFEHLSHSEIFNHTVSFGRLDKTKRLLAKLIKPTSQIIRNDAASVPTPFDISTVGTSMTANSSIWNAVKIILNYGGTTEYVPSNFFEDAISPKLLRWTSEPFDLVTNTLTFDIGQAPPADGWFEVRYSDKGWGTTNSKNGVNYGVITDAVTTSRIIQIPRLQKPNGVIFFVRAVDSSGRMSRFSAGCRVVFPDIPLHPNGVTAVGGTLTRPVFKANLPIDDDGVVVLRNDIFGLEASYAQEIPINPTSTWLHHDANPVTFGTPYLASAGDNPGAYKISAANPTGLTYYVVSLTLGANPTDLRSAGYIFTYPTGILMSGKTGAFVLWLKNVGASPVTIRLNIKDSLVNEYNFYSKSDFTVPVGTWYPLYTRAKCPSFTQPDTRTFNVVLHNVGANTASLLICLPFLCVAFFDAHDIVMGATEDNPYLQFTYNND